MPAARVVAESLAAAVAVLVTGTTLTGHATVVPTGPAAIAGLELLAGWGFLAAGHVAWDRRPGNRTGPLLAAAGTAWFVSLVPFSTGAGRLPEALLAAGWLLQSLWPAVLVHLVLAFPDGRLAGPAARAVVVASYVVAATASVVAALSLATGGQPGSVCPECPANPLLAISGSGTASVASLAVNLAGAALAGSVGVLVGVRWRAASLAGRRALAPVLWAGAAVTLLVAVDTVTTAASQVPARDEPTDVLLVLAVGAVPLGFLAGLLRSRLDRADVADALPALAGLSGVAAAGGLRELLARVLRDPSLEVAYRLPARRPDALGRDVDGQGRPVELPGPGSGRVLTPVVHDGDRVGTLVHDPLPAADDQLLAAAASAAGLSMANERLRAELRAQIAEVTASRARLVAAVDAERRRTERDLHDGVQQRLLAVILLLTRAGLAADPGSRTSLLAEARAGVQLAVEDIRALSQGFRPAVLAERGLPGALTELTWTAAVPVTVRWQGPREPRLPEAVEAAAYYVVAEAVANVSKHADASGASVEVVRGEEGVSVAVTDDGRGGAEPSGGSGLTGLADRVAALGGQLRLASPPGGGTTVAATLPCR